MEIENLRVKYLKGDYLLPKDQDILNECYKFVIFCVNNFPFPQTHNSYFKYNLQVNVAQEKEAVIRELIDLWSQTEGTFQIEFLLRALEVLFSFGKNFSVSGFQEEIIQTHIRNLIQLSSSGK